MTSLEMHHLLAYTIERISVQDPKAGKKLLAEVGMADPVFNLRAEEFLARFKYHLESTGQSFDYGIECFLRLRTARAAETMTFLRTGAYSNKSFADVAERVYHDPGVMQYHMYGLVFAQFLWPDQYRRYSFFCDTFAGYVPGISNYLEIGGGHALYIRAAASLLPATSRISVVDISASSLELAKGMIQDERIRWHHSDIFDFIPDVRYDFITMGEVLEHLEDPRTMLRRILDLLKPDGVAYITTPANAPMIDHIYLFHNAEEIRDMLRSCRFNIESETTMAPGGMSAAKAAQIRVPLMYAAFVRPTGR